MISPSSTFLIKNKDIDGAKQFIVNNKDNLGEYFDHPKQFLAGSEGVNGLLDKVKGLL